MEAIPNKMMAPIFAAMLSLRLIIVRMGIRNRRTSETMLDIAIAMYNMLASRQVPVVYGSHMDLIGLHPKSSIEAIMIV